MVDYAKYLKNLPVIPDVAAKVLSVAEDKLDISFRDLENTIKLDPGLSAKILKVANSALYARQKEISNLQMAITLLGFKNIKSLVLLVTASNMFVRSDLSGFFKFFWKHSIINAFMAKEMAIKTGNKGQSDECFLAGLLHDIGQVALFNADPAKYQTVRRQVASEAVRISVVEQALFGTNHREVGAEVLRNWSFPDVYIDSAREHGSPNVTSEFKQIILLISVSDFLTSNIDTYVEAPLDVKLLDDIMRQSSLTYEDLGYYTGEFLEKLGEDPLFNECRTLFKID